MQRTVKNYPECRESCRTIAAMATRVPFSNQTDREISTLLLTCCNKKFWCSSAVSARYWWSSDTLLSLPVKSVIREGPVLEFLKD